DKCRRRSIPPPLQTILEERPHIDWNSWKFISDKVQRNYNDLPDFDPSRKDILDRLVVVKLNGGLGQRWVAQGRNRSSKSKDSSHFLTLLRQQHEDSIRGIFCSTIAMNSLLHAPSKQVQNLALEAMCGLSASRDALESTPTLFFLSRKMDLIKEVKLITSSRDIMFVSNIDNTGATLDLKIAQFRL
ncbi:hypothetical protein OSTOST_09654, partial [Ostertagia ostertagi]